MKINIFEGARRLTKLIAVIWVLGMGFYAFTEKGYVHTYFRVDSPNGVPTIPIKMGEKEHCDKNDAEEYLSSQYTSKGSEISVTLCFKPEEIRIVDKIPSDESNEWIVITDKEAKDLKQAGQKKVVANFKFSKADEEWADSVARSKRWENIKISATVTIGGLAFLWIFSWCVGWIVRGFAGIPSGQDFKS